MHLIHTHNLTCIRNRQMLYLISKNLLSQLGIYSTILCAVKLSRQVILEVEIVEDATCRRYIECVLYGSYDNHIIMGLKFLLILQKFSLYMPSYYIHGTHFFLICHKGIDKIAYVPTLIPMKRQTFTLLLLLNFVYPKGNELLGVQFSSVNTLYTRESTYR